MLPGVIAWETRSTVSTNCSFAARRADLPVNRLVNRCAFIDLSGTATTAARDTPPHRRPSGIYYIYNYIIGSDTDYYVHEARQACVSRLPRVFEPELPAGDGGACLGGSDEEMVIDVRVNIHTRQNPDGDEIATLPSHA